MDAKDYLIEILDFYKYKLQTGGCGMSEMNDVLHALEENMELNGSIEDFAKFYGQTEQNIRTTINRNLIDKPKRKILYPFHKFSKVIPPKWRKK